MRALIIATIGSLVAFGAASAQTAPVQTYGNAGVTQHHTDGSDTLSITGRYGAELSKYLGVEGEAGIGVATDTVSGVKLKNKADLGAYAVAKAPVSDNLKLLGRIGYHHTWAEAKAGGLSVEADDGSFAAGVGAEYMFDAKNGVRGDYTRFTKDDGVDNVAVTYVRKF